MDICGDCACRSRVAYILLDGHARHARQIIRDLIVTNFCTCTNNPPRDETEEPGRAGGRRSALPFES